VFAETEDECTARRLDDSGGTLVEEPPAMSQRSLPRFLRRIARRLLPVRASTNGTPSSEFSGGLCSMKLIDPADIVIAGYPKSGNTWMQVLISGVIYGVSPLYAPDSLVQELVPDVHSKTWYRRFQTPMFFKSHKLPSPEYRRVIHLLRDGRDVMVSYLHYQRTTTGLDIPMSEMMRIVETHFPGAAWHSHVSSWIQNPYSADMITVKYEDLLSDPVRELARICDFAAVERPREFLECIARGSSFDRMKQREQVLGWDHPQFRKIPKDKPFVRRGIAGAYRDEFPAVCLERFLADAAPTLLRCGYSLD
jgi:hypothetical protein